MNEKPEIINIGKWVFRAKEAPKTSISKVMLLLHGHLGNENVMWVLTNPLPDSYTFIAPRAPLHMGEDQYSWHEIQKRWPDLEIYRDFIQDFLTQVDNWLLERHINAPKLDIMGFSQGAVVAYAMALLFPERIGKIAALAGFIPRNWKSQISPENLKARKVYIAHGTKDNTIPIEKAHEAVSWLKMNGADVTFCESDVDHKLSPNCYRGLGEFFKLNGSASADDGDHSQKQP